jgi:hypothetical protein
VKPSALELVSEFLHQLEKTNKFTQIVTSSGEVSPSSLSPASPTPESERPHGILSGPVPVSETNRAKRLWELCEKIVKECSFSLSDIESLPIIAQKKLILSLVESEEEEVNAKYQIMLHHWILRSILNPDVDNQYILNPKHELIDFDSEYTIDDIGKDSTKFLHSKISEHQVDYIETNLIETIAQFYFKMEQFKHARELFQRVLEGKVEDEHIVKRMIHACDCVLRVNKESQSDQLLTRIEQLSQHIADDPTSADELISCLLEDNVANILPLGYREEQLANIPTLRFEMKQTNMKIHSCNIVKQLVQITSTLEDKKVQLKHWRDFIITSKYFSADVQLIAAFTLIYGLKTIEMLQSNDHVLSDFLVTLAEVVDDAITWITLITAAKNLITNSGRSEINLKEYQQKFERAVRRQYLVLKSFFKMNTDLSDLQPIPSDTLQTIRNTMEKLKQSALERQQEQTTGRKRKYEEMADEQHYLITKQRKLSHNSELYVPYMLHNARERLNNGSEISTLSHEHAAQMFCRALEEVKQQENIQTQQLFKYENMYDYDVILLELAHKSKQSSTPGNNNNNPLGKGTPKNKEQFEKTMSLLKGVRTDKRNDESTPPIAFLVGLVRLLVNTDDWGFIKSYFGKLSKMFPDEHGNSTAMSTYCAFVDTLQRLYIYSYSDQSADGFLFGLRDLTYHLIFNLRSKNHSAVYSIAELRKQKNSFYNIVETNNLAFKKRMAAILSFVLTCLRRSVSNDTPVPGHFFELAENEFSGDVKNSTLGHIPRTFELWRGTEAAIDEMVVDMLLYVLDQLVEQHTDELCNSVALDQDSIDNGHLYYFLLGDIHFERKLFSKALRYYMLIGQELLDRNPSLTSDVLLSLYSCSTLLRMVHCLNMMGEYTAAAVFHQFVPISTQQQQQQNNNEQFHDPAQPKILGFDKRMIMDLNNFNELDRKWLLYFWDLSYVELLTYIEHNKTDSENEKLLLQHLQRSEMNMNNSILKTQFIEHLKIDFMNKLYIHITTLQE